MEDTLRVYLPSVQGGRQLCLNPCFNGRYSQRMQKTKVHIKNQVLILVLMEDTLRDVRVVGMLHSLDVLILVLMEDTLRELRRGLKVSFYVKS